MYQIWTTNRGTSSKFLSSLEQRAEEHQRLFEDQARVKVFEGQNRQLEVHARQLRELISRNIEQIREIKETKANV